MKQTIEERVRQLHKNLIDKRIILIEGVLTESSGAQVETLLDILGKQEDPIDIYINSPGGAVKTYLRLCDKMLSMKNRISTVCLEQANCGAAILLACGSKPYRMALPHAKILAFQPLWVKEDRHTDLQKAGEEILSVKKEIGRVFSLVTEGRLSQQDMFDIDQSMDVKKALEKGLIDKIISP